MPYVDGFIVAVPKDRMDDYRAMSEACAKIWMEFGALTYVECVADDVPYGELTSFPRAVMAKDDETVVFSWITYESREKRDEVNKKIMADERLAGMAKNSPFDGKRMIFGGFKTFIEH